MRSKIVVAIFASLLALVLTEAINEAEAGVPKSQSLASRTIHGVLTIPCDDGCSNVQQGGGEFNKVEGSVKSVASRLRSTLKSIRKLSKEDRLLKEKEAKRIAEEKSLIAIAKKLDSKFTQVVEVAGPQGKAGPRGPRGKPGRRGARGIHGVGVLGPPGPPGPAGAQGTRGVGGPNGFVGPRGPPGPRGATGRGPRGPRGPPGNKGVRGPRGERGPKGSRGQRGDKGDKGLVGGVGPNGPPGPSGPAGPQGPKGPKGVIGKQGLPGPRGPRGNNAVGAPGPRGPTGPKGDQGTRGIVGKIVKAPIVDNPEQSRYMLTPYTSGYTWVDADKACKINGFGGLCSLSNLCPNGARKPSSIATNRDTWIPYAGDGLNAWVSIGNNREFCVPHQKEFNVRPDWGMTRGVAAYRGPLYCCGGALKKYSYITKLGESFGMNWKDVRNVCKANNLRLCNYATICPNGGDHAPFTGELLNHDAWAAVDEGEDMWVQVGNGWPACKRHTELNGAAYGRPGWGENRDRSGFHAGIFCCADQAPPKPETPHKIGLMSNGYSWDDIHDLCKNYDMHMCTIRDMCPNGWGETPYGGRRGRDDWAAISDGRPDSWVQIGNGWPQCHRHSEINNGAYGRPSWGNERNTGGFHAAAYCCGKKPKPCKVKSIGTSQGKNWDDAYDACKAKGLKLAKFWDICPDGWNGKPVMGQANHDSWTPILDAGTGNFLQIGNGWPVCHKHSEIAGGAYGRPGWGTQRGGEAYRADIFCCEK